MDVQSLFATTKFRMLLAALALVAPLEAMSLLSLHLSPIIEYPLILSLIVVTGHRVLLSGLKSLRNLDFSNIDLLMTIATAGALYLGELEEAAIIIILFALSDALEEFGVARSQQALTQLIESAPKTATVKGQAEPVLVDDVLVGATILIKPGEQISLDGDVTFGSSLVNESTVTGEPLPRDKRQGDRVFAGTLNGPGYLEVRVTKVAADSTLAKIIELTSAAAERKSRSEQFVERFAAKYTPAVVAGAALLTVIPVVGFGQPFGVWFEQALTLLVIACPCALVVSTPVAVFSALGNASRRGVLIKGGRYIEALGQIRAIAFDKTRTLTKGEPAISDVLPYHSVTAEELLACTAGVEAYSEHPIARSITLHAAAVGVTTHGFVNFEAIPGKGLKGDCIVCTDVHHCVGSLRFVTEEHEVDADIMAQVERLERQGKTAVVACESRQVKGVIGITDELRPESARVIREVQQLGITTVMLTGDNKAAADYVAGQIGIEVVRAGLLPQQKAEEITSLVQRYQHVAMVGDGVNDAPALATASVSIALGAVGSDAAIENADIALMRDDIGTIPFLIRLGRHTVRMVKMNIAAAIGVKAIFVVLALAGMSNLALAIFADVGVTILVILNGLTLYSFERPSYVQAPLE